MLKMARELQKRTPQEKGKILIEIQNMGVKVVCRKYGISRTLYYDWLDRYTASGIEGLEDRRAKIKSSDLKRLKKENRMLKELLAERELESKLKDDLLKKSLGNGEKKRNSVPLCWTRP
jgi:putative transposase